MRRKITIKSERFNFCDIVLRKIFKNYTLKVYRAGIITGVLWNKNVDNVNDMSTVHKIK